MKSKLVKFQRRSAWISLCLLIVGMIMSPAFAGKVKPGYELGKKKDVGLAVLSITLSGLDAPGTGHFLFLRYRPVGSNTGPMLALNIAMDTGLFKKTPSDFPDLYGAVLAYELKEGDYEIIEYMYQPNPTQEFKKTKSKEDLKLRFHVQAETVTYVGNFNVKIEAEDVGSEEVVDNSDRDLPIFISRFKKIPAEMIVISLMGLDKPGPVKPYAPRL